MSNTKTSYIPFIILTAFSIFAIVAGMYFSGSLKVKPEPKIVNGTFFSKPTPVVNFSLQDHNKQPFNASSFKNKWSFVFFGFTNCPDVCPETMKILKIISIDFKDITEKAVKEARKKNITYRPTNIQFVFISIDPARDTPEKLSNYIKYFGSNFVGVTGKKSQLDILTKYFGIHYKVTSNKDISKYKVEHSGHIALVNPQGEWQALFRYKHNSENLKQEFIAIRHYLGK